MNDATLRSWVKLHDLKLGDRAERESGNPRYDLADCARMFMLRLLVKEAGMAAPAAIWATNAAYQHIALIAELELAAIDDRKSPNCPRYVLRLPLSAMTKEINPTIRLFGEPAEVAAREDSRGLWFEIQMDLREIVREARTQLVRALGHVTSGLPHDFADALNPQPNNQAA